MTCLKVTSDWKFSLASEMYCAIACCLHHAKMGKHDRESDEESDAQLARALQDAEEDSPPRMATRRTRSATQDKPVKFYQLEDDDFVDDDFFDDSDASSGKRKKKGRKRDKAYAPKEEKGKRPTTPAMAGLFPLDAFIPSEEDLKVSKLHSNTPLMFKSHGTKIGFFAKSSIQRLILLN